MPDEEEAAEAFGTLSDPTRVAILRAFAEALDEQGLTPGGSMPELSFSELYERVEIDSTSRLSYHLEKLDGAYLRHTDEGWKFTYAGEAIVRQYLAGAYAGDVELDPFEIEGRCLHCDAEELVTDVEDRMLMHRCEECGECFGNIPVTPAQVTARDDDAVIESVKTRTASYFQQFREGVCAICGGCNDLDVRNVEDVAPGPLRFVAIARCRSCWTRFNGPLSVWLATHPASIAFHWEQGIDTTSLSTFEMVPRVMDEQWSTDRLASDTYEVTYRVDENALRLLVDDDLSVERAERVRRDSVGDR
ncbi:helix-turn-helix domain-containing protein [Natronococcus sp. A-GB7]|uniref:ArsR/SmtB family transcription factor n=1 Tax=Natronococcus sp. A-GB7 TaxID=3037649 RepID=UPI00241E1126|nr:helix-turn-helix domain-containing protein [Natronococcus sp. A-GB7]MDG5817956.1 helix-turn-helix domain-containing protein [Natronococcus sp. A-GB7]